ncbi:MAG: Ig-like domain-containing protein, partial [Bacillales bacterium]|nr:Ig-like domain-containing protein [Bacillales bacterium]
EAVLANNNPGDGFGGNSPFGAEFYFRTTIGELGKYNRLDGIALDNAKSHIEINGKLQSEDSTLQIVRNMGGGRYELHTNGGLPIGSVITIKTGLVLFAYTGTFTDGSFVVNGDGYWDPLQEVKADMSFVKSSGNGYVVFGGQYPASLTIETSSSVVAIDQELQLTTVVGPTGTYGQASFVSSDSSVLEVTTSGKVTGKAEGTATITASILASAYGGGPSVTLTDSIEITVTAAKEIKRLQLVDAYVQYKMLKGTDVTDFDPNLRLAKFIYVDDTNSSTFNIEGNYTVDEFSTTGDLGDLPVGVHVSVNSVVYDTIIIVNIYEYVDQVIDEVGIVDWYNYATFLQVKNTSTNVANFTSGSFLNELKTKISYARADGTPVTAGINNNGFLQLGNNIVFFPFGNGNLNVDNYNDYYLAGDIITVESGTPMQLWTGAVYDNGSDNHAIVEGSGEVVVEGYVPETVQFKYDGNVWITHVESTGIEVAHSTIDLRVNETKTAGVSRVPANATDGQFTYVSDDEEIATVSTTGVIRGIGEGTTHITATLNGTKVVDNSVTIEVNVTDFAETIEFTSEANIKVGASLSLSGITANAVFASGATEAITDWAGAQIGSFDNTTVGTKNVIVSLTYKGELISGQLKVNVTQGNTPDTSNPDTSTPGTSNGPTTSGCKQASNGGGAVGLVAVSLVGLTLFVLKKKD